MQETVEPPRVPPCLDFYRDGLCLDERYYKSHNALAMVVCGVPGEGSADKARCMGLLFQQFEPRMTIMTRSDEGCVVFSRQDGGGAGVAAHRAAPVPRKKCGAQARGAAGQGGGAAG